MCVEIVLLLLEFYEVNELYCERCSRSNAKAFFSEFFFSIKSNERHNKRFGCCLQLKLTRNVRNQDGNLIVDMHVTYICTNVAVTSANHASVPFRFL